MFFISSLSCSRLLFICFLCIILWLPLPLGSNPLWARYILQLIIAVVSLSFLLCLLNGRVQLTDSFVRALPVLFIFLFAACWQYFQSVTIPAEWIKTISPVAYDRYLKAYEVLGYSGDGKMAVSLDSHATAMHATMTVNYTLLFALTLLLVDSKKRLTYLYWVIMLSGAFQAIFGAFNLLAGTGWFFFGKKAQYSSYAMGTFINRNSYANYLGITLAAGFGLLTAEFRYKKISGFKRHLASILQIVLSRRGMIRGIMMIMVVGLVLSRSRMGNMSFFISVFLVFFYYVIARGKSKRTVLWLLASFIVIDLFIINRLIGLKALILRIERTDLSTEARGDILSALFEMLQSVPLTGIGSGAFYTALPAYHDGTWTGFFDLAHNDWLQFPIELGFPVFMLLLIAVLLCYMQAMKAVSRRKSSFCSGMAIAPLIAITAVGLHSLTDFSLQIPANASLFCIMLATCFITRYLLFKPKTQSVGREKLKRIHQI